LGPAATHHFSTAHWGWVDDTCMDDFRKKTPIHK
jgi:hypothetical protein